MCVPEHMEHMGCVPLEHTLSCVPNLEHKASCVSKMVDFSNTPRTLPILDLGHYGLLCVTVTYSRMSFCHLCVTHALKIKVHSF